MTGCLGIDLDS